MVLGSPVSMVSIVENTGGTNLTDLLIAIDGPHASDFTLTSGPATSTGVWTAIGSLATGSAMKW